MRLLVLVVAALTLACAGFEPPALTDQEIATKTRLEYLMDMEKAAILNAQSAEEATLHQARLDVYWRDYVALRDAYMARVQAWQRHVDAIGDYINSVSERQRNCTSTTYGGVTHTQCY